MKTIEEKAKAYDEALERAKETLGEMNKYHSTAGIDDIEYIFPELRESEDEIHRKWILEYLYDGLRKADEQFKDHFKSAIDWLEKQKEQKPTSFNEPYNPDEYEVVMEGNATSLKRKERNPTWSEEDEKMFCNLIGIMEGKMGVLPGGWKKYVDWMKNRYKYAFPMPHWKPSEEQMKALAFVIDSDKPYCLPNLESLYNDLKKLM